MDDVLVFVPGMLGRRLERDGVLIWGGFGPVGAAVGLSSLDVRADERTVIRQSVAPIEWPDDGDAIPLPQAHVGLPYALSTYLVMGNALTAIPRDQQDMPARPTRSSPVLRP